MFAATPTFRDRLNLRTMALIALIALGAFGAQLAFLAGMVAHPLGGAIAAYEQSPQAESTPPEAIARVRDDVEPRVATAGARLAWEPPALAEAQVRALPLECLVYR